MCVWSSVSSLNCYELDDRVSNVGKGRNFTIRQQFLTDFRDHKASYKISIWVTRREREAFIHLHPKQGLRMYRKYTSLPIRVTEMVPN